MVAISVADVSRRYGETVALDGVSLTVEDGEIFCLVGPNGAGKTTLVRAITGTTAYAGTVEVLGGNPRTIDHERLGLLPQDFSPPDRLTVRELLEFYGGLYDDCRSHSAVITAVGLSDEADTYYEQLSGGQQRRACVAITLINDPDLLILDEPTTGIDPAGRRQLWDLLEGLAADGTTILLTTHYMHEASRLGARVGLLVGGDLVAVDTPKALIERYGGPSRLEVGIPDQVIDSTDEDSAIEQLTYLNTMVDGGFTIDDVAPEDIAEIVKDLETAGIEYESLTWREPDLEDVYLALAGDEEEAYQPSNAGGPIAGRRNLIDEGSSDDPPGSRGER